MPTSAPWKIEDVSDLLLLILRANASTGRSQLSGVTRLQKLAFLVTQDARYAHLVRSGDAPDVDFEPYKMGPFTPDIYEAVETLATFQPPLVVASRDVTGFDAMETARYVDEVDLDAHEAIGRSQLRPMEFRLTDEGRRVADALWRDCPPELRSVITEVVAKFGRLPLRELLRRVYASHPEMTIRSEIRGDLGLR